MERPAAAAARQATLGGPRHDQAEMSPEHWQSVLNDPSAGQGRAGVAVGQRRLSEIGRHLLRVSCRRCDRIVEIQTADATRLFGANAIWKDVALRLLDEGCRQRTGSRNDDGCWPAMESL